MLICIILSAKAFGQKKDGIILQGVIYNNMTKKPADTGTVIVLEIKKEAYSDAQGYYRIIIPKPGEYTLIVKSLGLKTFITKIALSKDTIKNFTLSSQIIKGNELTITGRREMQTVSRHSITLQQIKSAPATFGDSINALATLPGIIRVGGDLFGPIVIRGGDRRGIRYLVDDIPIYSPLHYGGLHSVINSNLINDIDAFTSAFPAEYGSATAGVISINTTDDVKRFGGYTDISLISATALIQTCIIRGDDNHISLGSPLEQKQNNQNNAGYIIASGRTGYIDLIVLPLLKLISGQNINIVPKYWDYQFKAKYFFNKAHSLTLFAMGSKDYFKFKNEKIDFNSGEDSLLTGFQVKTDQQMHGQGLYYMFKPSEKFRNRITFSSSLKQNYISVLLPSPGVSYALRLMKIDSRPNIFGVSDKFKYKAINNYLEIRGGIEYNLYWFVVNGLVPASTGRENSSDLSNNNSISIPLNEKILNHTIGGYTEIKITYKGLTIMPSFRTDYLKRTHQATWDPRCLISYEFDSGTTLSIAGGKNSYFFQTNPSYFDTSPQYSKITKNSKYEWSIHRVIGLEQTIKLFKIKAEGFYNEFFNLTQRYVHIGPDWSFRYVMNTGKIRAYGAELLVKLDKRENEDGFFGWISYTYTRSQYRSGLPYYPAIYGIYLDASGNTPGSINDVLVNNIGDPYGKRWINYGNEQNHSLKVILGYALGKHSISGRFQLYSSTPYTPIVYGMEDQQYYATWNIHRYYPVYGTPNSRHFPINHRLDLRYGVTQTYSWGYVSWYIEIINVYNYRPTVFEKWNYYLPYLGTKNIIHTPNPSRGAMSTQIALIPNFGVEVKF